MSSKVYISSPKSCNFCPRTAKYDFRMSNGQWAYGCQQHWQDLRANVNLGTGWGQELVVGEPPEKSEAELKEEILQAVEGGDFDTAFELCGDRDPMEFI